MSAIIKARKSTAAKPHINLAELKALPMAGSGCGCGEGGCGS